MSVVYALRKTGYYALSSAHQTLDGVSVTGRGTRDTCLSCTCWHAARRVGCEDQQCSYVASSASYVRRLSERAFFAEDREYYAALMISMFEEGIE